MSGELSLFGDDQPDQQQVDAAPAPPLAAAWQVDLLRKALDGRGLSTMEDRQAVIEAAVGRSVDSLRALTHEEALQTLVKFGQSSPSKARNTSAWDERDEDTWIDRL